MIQRMGAGFCPLGGLVQGDGYGRRPPGRSPGRAPLRGAPPAAPQRGACGRPPAPCTNCKKGKHPCDPAPEKHLPYLKAPTLFIGSAPAGRFFAPRGEGRNRMVQREALPPTH